MNYVLPENGKVVDVLRVHPTTIWPQDTADRYRAAPNEVQVGWLDDGLTFSPPPAVPLAERQAEAVVRIDADVDAIYDKVMGRRQAEYERAEEEGRAFADAGYTGTVPPMVQSHAVAKAWTAKAAADDILAVSAQWRTAQEVLRAQRLLRKEQARNALGHAALDAVLATWAGYVAAMRAQLGIGGA